MKDSGIEWIGEIPKEWNLVKFKNICNLYTGNSIKDTKKDNYLDSEGARAYISTKDIDIDFGHVEYSNGLYVKNDDNAFKIAPKNSILICIEGGSAGRKKAFLSKEVSFVNKLCCIYSTSANNQYIYYWINSPNFEQEFFNHISGLIGGVSVSSLKQFILCLPNMDEQNKIANYLDDKCSKIDEIIEKQQSIIEKLKEYKLSAITETVTKGLNPDVEMKDSGIEWIGNIPEHWETQKLKYATKIMRGKFNHRPRNDPNYYNGKYPFVQTGDVARASKFIESYTQTLNELGYSVSKEFPKGSICMTIAANVGDVAVLDFNACFPDSVIGFFPLEELNWNYLYHVLSVMKQQLTRNAIISTQLNLNIEIVKEEYIPVGPYKEQLEITKYLDKKCFAIENLIKQRKIIIEKLIEYKKSLIYEVVTGKKEFE